MSVSEVLHELKESDRLVHDRKWTALSREYREKHPNCEMCGEPASVVHHRNPIEGGGNPHHRGNLQSLCMSCHRNKHEEMLKSGK